MSSENHPNHRDDDPDERELENAEQFIPLPYDPRDFHPKDQPSDGPRPAYRSQKLILRHEEPAEYEAMHKSWWDEYQPSGHIEETLVQLLIDNHWLLKRARLRLEQAEWEMPLNAKHWVESYQKLIETFTRFKNTAERAFFRSFREVERYLRECLRDENAAHKAELMRLKIEAQIASKSEKVSQIPLKGAKSGSCPFCRISQVATPLYRDRRDRAAARAKRSTNPEHSPLSPPSVPIRPHENP